MDKILKYSTLGYAILIFYGYSYMAAYYSRWGIQIYSYLDASEILMSFLNNIDRYISLINIFLCMFGFSFLVSLNPIWRKDSTTMAMQKALRVLWSSYIGLILVFILCLIVVYLLSTQPKYNIPNNIECYFPFVYIILGMIIFLFFFKIPTQLLKINMTVNVPAFRLVIVLFYLYFVNVLGATGDYLEAKDVKHNFRVTNISFNYDSKLVKSNDTLAYVGITSKYIFLNDIKSNINYIFEKEKISNLKISKRFIFLTWN